jgi:hypothetical protein
MADGVLFTCLVCDQHAMSTVETKLASQQKLLEANNTRGADKSLAL